jgi:hypothetical protein
MAGKYATKELHGGLDWRSISRVMGKEQQKLSPSRVRGLFIKTMETVAHDILRKTKGRVSLEEAEALAKDPAFQHSIGCIMRLAYGDNEEWELKKKSRSS